MAKRTHRLTINSHTDCIILMNAVREHTRQQSDAFQAAFVRSSREGNEREAQAWLQRRKEMDLCGNRTHARLEKIRQKFEDMIPEDNYWNDAEDASGGYGYSTDNATCYN